MAYSIWPPLSHSELKEALDSLQQKRDGQLLREMTSDSLSNLRNEGENIVSGNMEWPGEKSLISKWLIYNFVLILLRNETIII